MSIVRSKPAPRRTPALWTSAAHPSTTPACGRSAPAIWRAIGPRAALGGDAGDTLSLVRGGARAGSIDEPLLAIPIKDLLLGLFETLA
jgi:hypothetical protein